MVCVAIATGLSTGCVTLTRHKALQARVTTLERDMTEYRTQLDRDNARLQRLHEDLIEGREQLRAGGANLGADIDTMKADIARLRGADEETVYKLSRAVEDLEMIKKALDERLGVALVKLPKGQDESPAALFKAGRSSMSKGDYRTARGLFQKLLDIGPDHALAPEAQYLVGETYLKEDKRKQAIREFQRVHDRYRSVKKAPVGKALTRIAEALLDAGDCKKARGVLKYLVDMDRKSPDAIAARNKLKKLGRNCKGR